MIRYRVKLCADGSAGGIPPWECDAENPSEAIKRFCSEYCRIHSTDGKWNVEEVASPMVDVGSASPDRPAPVPSETIVNPERETEPDTEAAVSVPGAIDEARPMPDVGLAPKTEAKDATATDPVLAVLSPYGVSDNDLAKLMQEGIERLSELRAYIREHGGLSRIRGIGTRHEQKIRFALEAMDDD